MAAAFLMIVATGLPAHGSCQSFDCHFGLKVRPINGAHGTLTETAGSVTSPDRLARYRALRTLANESQRVALIEYDQQWVDTTGLEVNLAMEATRFASEADALLAQWSAEDPGDPRLWLARIETATSVETRARLLDEAYARMPEEPTIKDYQLVRKLVRSLRAEKRLDESWSLVDQYIANNPKHEEAYQTFSSAWQREDQARRQDLVARWLEQLPHSRAAHSEAIDEFESTSRFRAVVEGIPDAITQIEASALGKRHLCNELRWVEGSADLALACHINVAANTVPSDYDDDTHLSFEGFFDTALELDRWDAIDSLLAALPSGPSEAARFEAAERVVIHDDHCQRALTLLDGVDFAGSRTDAAASWLVNTLYRCFHSDDDPETEASTRRMAEMTLAGLSDQQLLADDVYVQEDLFFEELERRLAVDPTNAALHAKLDSQLEESLRDDKKCQCARAVPLATWADALPDDDEPWRRLAEAYQASGKPGPATHALEQAWQRAPEDRVLVQDLVDAALVSRNFDLAETAGTYLLETADGPKATAEAHLALFRVAVDRGVDHGSGREDRDVAIGHGRAYFPLAIRYERLRGSEPERAFLALLLQDGHPTEIERYVRIKAGYLDPENSASPIIRREAIWRYHEIETDPQRDDVSRMLGDVWVSLGRPDLALPHYEAAAEHLPPHPETLVRLARSRGATGTKPRPIGRSARPSRSTPNGCWTKHATWRIVATPWPSKDSTPSLPPTIRCWRIA